MKFIIRYLLFLLYFFFFSFLCSNAQFVEKAHYVNGIVTPVQNSDKIVVALVRTKDSSIVLQSKIDSSGKFEFEIPSSGIFFLAVLEEKVYKVCSMPFDSRTLKGGRIYVNLYVNGRDSILPNVTVVSKRPIIERNLGKLIYHINQDDFNRNGTLLDALQSLPGVIIDPSGSIKIKGLSHIKLYVDGNEKYFDEDQLKKYLESLSANSFKDVEIISNPSAEYSADGSAIIKLITKKETKKGLSGNLYSNYSQGYYGRIGLGGILNIKYNKFSFSGSYDFTNYTSFFDAKEYRNFSNPSTMFYQVSSDISKIKNNYYRTGFEYQISKKQTIGLSVEGAFSNRNNPFNSTLYVSSTSTIPDSTFLTNSYTKSSYNNNNVNATYKLDIDSPNNIIINYSHLNYSAKAVSDFHSLMTSSYSPFNSDVIYRTDNKQNINVDAFKIDYSNEITKQLSIQSGIKLTHSYTRNDQNFWIDSTIYDSLTNNSFKYDENIFAAYLSALKTSKHFDFQIGLRYENTNAKIRPNDNQGIINRNINNLFPTLFTEYRFSDANKINYSFSRRIRRPGYSDLNPTIFYFDQFSYSKGNHYLLPELTFSQDLTYVFNNQISISVGLSNSKNLINEITLQNDTTKSLIYQYENITKSNNVYIEFYFPIKFTKWWNGTISTNLSNTSIIGNENYGSFSKSINSAFINIQNTFSLNKYSLQVGWLYFSPQIDGVVTYKERNRLTLGMKRSLWNNRLSVNLRVSDPFLSDIIETSTNVLNQSLKLRQIRDTRRVGLTFTYNFSKGEKLKSKNIETGAVDEKNRLNVIPKNN